MSKEQQWHVEPMKIHGWAIHDAEGHVVVANIYDEEIARSIVRAVNNHEPLVKTLRQMLNVFFPHACLPGSVCARCEVLVVGQKALTLAEKEN